MNDRTSTQSEPPQEQTSSSQATQNNEQRVQSNNANDSYQQSGRSQDVRQQYQSSDASGLEDNSSNTNLANQSNATSRSYRDQGADRLASVKEDATGRVDQLQGQGSEKLQSARGYANAGEAAQSEGESAVSGYQGMSRAFSVLLR